jgi:hypothetical protein
VYGDVIFIINEKCCQELIPHELIPHDEQFYIHKRICEKFGRIFDASAKNLALRGSKDNPQGCQRSGPSAMRSPWWSAQGERI